MVSIANPVFMATPGIHSNIKNTQDQENSVAGRHKEIRPCVLMFTWNSRLQPEVNTLQSNCPYDFEV